MQMPRMSAYLPRKTVHIPRNTMLKSIKESQTNTGVNCAQSFKSPETKKTAELNCCHLFLDILHQDQQRRSVMCMSWE